MPYEQPSPLRRRRTAIRRRLARLPRRLRVPLRAQHPPLSPRFALWSLISGTLGILAIAAVTELFGHPLLIGSFGASAVLLFGTPDSPLTQPRNLIGGHLISAAVAIVLVALFGSNPLTMALAVGLAIFFMNLTHTTHPPGGATALIGVQGAAGWSYIFVPVLTGALILLAVTLFTSNVVHHRRYPRHWF